MTQDFLQGLLGDMMVVVGTREGIDGVAAMTLTFVPKVIVAAIVLMMMGPWMLNTLIAFTESVWAHIPEMTASAS